VKHVYVLRHAKAVPDDPGGDHARPLAAKGRRQAADLPAAVAAAEDAGAKPPAVILTSSAVRARQTAEAVAGAHPAARLLVEGGLYQADADDIVDRLRLVDEDAAAAMVVGHNPALLDLVLLLLEPAERAAVDRFPTAALAVVALPAERWARLGTATGHLIRLTP